MFGGFKVCSFDNSLGFVSGLSLLSDVPIFIEVGPQAFPNNFPVSPYGTDFRDGPVFNHSRLKGVIMYSTMVRHNVNDSASPY